MGFFNIAGQSGHANLPIGSEKAVRLSEAENSMSIKITLFFL
jgi:hypothetical protein